MYAEFGFKILAWGCAGVYLQLERRSKNNACDDGRGGRRTRETNHTETGQRQKELDQQEKARRMGRVIETE